MSSDLPVALRLRHFRGGANFEVGESDFVARFAPGTLQTEIGQLDIGDALVDHWRAIDPDAEPLRISAHADAVPAVGQEVEFPLHADVGEAHVLHVRAFGANLQKLSAG